MPEVFAYRSWVDLTGLEPLTSCMYCSASHNAHQVPLRRHFENFAPALKTVVSRWRRGLYKKDQRPLEPAVRDERGRVVRSIGKAQTFLTEAQVDQVVEMHENGMSMERIAQTFRAHRRTIAAYLVRRGRPLDVHRRIHPKDAPTAAALYADGRTLAEIGRHFGVSQAAARTAGQNEGMEIRPRGRFPRRQVR